MWRMAARIFKISQTSESLNMSTFMADRMSANSRASSRPSHVMLPPWTPKLNHSSYSCNCIQRLTKKEGNYAMGYKMLHKVNMKHLKICRRETKITVYDKKQTGGCELCFQERILHIRERPHWQETLSGKLFETWWNPATRILTVPQRHMRLMLLCVTCFHYVLSSVSDNFFCQCGCTLIKTLADFIWGWKLYLMRLPCHSPRACLEI